MTLIVGAVGKGGIVLAADKNFVKPGENEHQIDDMFLGRKIVHIEKHKVIYGFSGNRLSQLAGKTIEEHFEAKAFKVSDPEGSIRRAVGAASKLPEIMNDPRLHGARQQMLVVLYGEEVEESPQLWKVDFTYSTSQAERCDGIAVIGAVGNAARFFQKYWKRNTPVDKLEQLCAHIVLAAEKWDGIIDGLDMAVISKHGYHKMTGDKVEAIRERYKSLDRRMTRLFN